MKRVYILFLILFIGYAAFAQSATKTDDGLLLDYYQSQRYAEAADYLKKAYPEPVSDMKIIAKLAYTSQMASRLVDAEGYYQRIYDNDSTNTGVLFNLGAINIRRANYLKAEIYYKRIISRDTTNFMVYKQLAKISLDRGELPGGLAYLIHANKLNAAEPDVASDLSDIYVNLKQYQLAENILGKAILADPENSVLLLSLLKLSSSQDKFAEVKATCLKLITLGDHSGYVLTKLGTAYYNLKEYECSISAIAEMSQTQQSETSCYITSMAYKELKDQPKAIENLLKAIDIGISPNIASYYGEIADSNEKLFKYKKAAQAYQKALQFTDSPTVYYLLANLYDSRLKDKRNATIYYRKFMASKPSGKQLAYLPYVKSRLGALKD